VFLFIADDSYGFHGMGKPLMGRLSHSLLRLARRGSAILPHMLRIAAAAPPRRRSPPLLRAPANAYDRRDCRLAYRSPVQPFHPTGWCLGNPSAPDTHQPTAARGWSRESGSMPTSSTDPGTASLAGEPGCSCPTNLQFGSVDLHGAQPWIHTLEALEAGQPANRATRPLDLRMVPVD